MKKKNFQNQSELKWIADPALSPQGKIWLLSS